MADIILWGIVILGALIMAAYAVMSGRPLVTAAKSTLSGAVSLLAAHFICPLFGITLTLGAFNLAFALVFGLPGVAVLIAGRLLL